MTLMRFDQSDELDRLSEPIPTGTRPRTLPMTAYRRGDELHVSMDVPGVEPRDVNVTVERNVVGVRALRPAPVQEGDTVVIDEQPYGEYTRQLFFGDNMDVGRMTAQMEMGVLSLCIPVAEASRLRRVEIGAGQSQPSRIDAEAGQQATADGGAGQQASADAGNSAQQSKPARPEAAATAGPAG